MLPTERIVRLFQAADVVELTGFSVSQPRNWSSPRCRKLIPTDVHPDGPGQHVLHSWQTDLVLQLLRELCTDFAVEIAAWAPGMVDLRQDLQGISFPSLWGRILTFRGSNIHALLSAKTTELSIREVIPLDPHLLPIATKRSLPPPEQLFLFPVHAVA